jgi:hypothetical protein
MQHCPLQASIHLKTPSIYYSYYLNRYVEKISQGIFIGHFYPLSGFFCVIVSSPHKKSSHFSHSIRFDPPPSSHHPTYRSTAQPPTAPSQIHKTATAATTMRTAAVLLSLVTGSHAFYLPGVNPQSFAEGDA